MLKLDAEIDVLLFFKWWGQQLSFILPKKFHEALSRSNSLLVVEINPDSARISYINNDQETLLGTFEFNALEKERLHDLIERKIPYKNVETVLRVPKQLSVIQDVFLPLASEENLSQVMSYELDRYTPFSKDQVYFDFIKVEQEKKQPHIHLILILVKKSTLDSMYKSCLTLGLKPSFSDSEIQIVRPTKKNTRYNLLPQELCRKANKTPLFILFGSVFLTLILLITVMAMPLIKTADGLQELKKYSRKVEQIAFKIEDSKKGIDYLYQATQQVIDRKKAAPPMLEIIDKLSDVLGDDTWVSRLHYVNNTLQIIGESGSASNLIGILEKMEWFHNVRFTSPVTKDNKTGLERFKISIEVRKEQSEAE